MKLLLLKNIDNLRDSLDFKSIPRGDEINSQMRYWLPRMFHSPPGMRIANLPRYSKSGRGGQMSSDNVDTFMATYASSSPISLIENVFPSELLALLQGRLFHQAEMNLGASSYFIPFDDSPPRSMVELVIKELIAPLVLGNLVINMFVIVINRISNSSCCDCVVGGCSERWI
jgi:hypothetical protein